MKKYHFGKIVIREIVFLIICFFLIGMAFSMSEKDIVGSDGEIKGNIVFPTTSGESAEGVS